MPQPYEPPDATRAPRYTGIRTFARCPHVADTLEGVDVAVMGVPFDTGTSMRAGTRFGPEAIRSVSVMLRPYNPAQQTQVFGSLSVVDRGDVEITPQNGERTASQIAAALEPVVRAGVKTLTLGGDHSIVLGELRAHAAVHGPVGLVLLDAHADVWDQYYGERFFHGTPFRRAMDEGLLDPSRSLLAGMRGSLYGPEDVALPGEMGFEMLTTDELVALGPAAYGARARELVGDGPTFFSFDIDVLDPGFAPGTGTPESGGLSPREALSFVRALAGISFSGFDVVEVSPPYDGPGQPTAVAALNVAYEMLTLAALAR